MTLPHRHKMPAARKLCCDADHGVCSRKNPSMDLALVIHHLLSRRHLLPVLLLGSLPVSCAAQADSPVVTQYTYDAGDHVVSVTDPRGLMTTYAHDGLGQLWQQVSPDTGTTSFAYDSYGRRSSMTRADGTQTTYGYDGLNRMTSVSAGGLTQSFTYDSCTNGIGRLCSDTDATGATSYSYTPEGWVAGRGFTIGSTTYALGYSYDSLGHVTTVNYPDGNHANYTYTNGVVSGLTLTMGSTTINGATAITYRPGNLAMAGWASSNGLVNTLSYDTDGRLTGISVPGKQSLGLTYDDANRIIQIANGIDGSLTQDFGYDDQSRLVSVYSGADNESFQYDANGNRLAQTGTVDTVSATSNRLVSSGSTQYGYDAMGNTTTVNATPTYHYDAFNRMDSAGGMAYYVSPEGQRLRKMGAAGTTWFAPGQSGALLAENPNGTWVDYVWLNGRLIGRMTGGQAYAIHDDQVGRPETVTDASQNVVWRAQNFAFTQNVTTAGITLNLGFPGQYYDAETGLWNNGFRDYSSVLGRYVESDPVGSVGGDNTYIYVLNNPLSNIDPLGLWPFGMPGKANAQQQLPGVLHQLAPSLTSDETSRISEDIINKLSWGDVMAIKSVTPDIKNATIPDSLSELTPGQLALLKKFLAKLPDRDKAAIAKILKECP
jgi:RHS repeat-associated protein